MIFDYFISDTHFNHERVIDYSSRPFASVQEMNAEIVQRHNRLVGPHNTVLWLGDVAFGSLEAAAEIVAMLNGYKVLVRGNHDRSPQLMLAMGFDVVVDSLSFSLAGRTVHAWHRPHHGVPSLEEGAGEAIDGKVVPEMVPPKRHDRSLLMHGHTHSKEQVRGRMIHVGVDAWNYCPASATEVEELIRGID